MPHSLDGKDAYDMCHELRAIGLNTEKGKLIKLPFSVMVATTGIEPVFHA